MSDSDSRLFQIKADDLVELERILPQAFDFVAMNSGGAKFNTMARVVQRILRDVRWEYGPPESVERIDP